MVHLRATVVPTPAAPVAPLTIEPGRRDAGSYQQSPSAFVCSPFLSMIFTHTVPLSHE